MPISFDELHNTYLFLCLGQGDNEAFLDPQSGKIYIRSPNIDEADEPLPEDIDDADRYLPLPDKRELDLGERLVLRFVDEFMPADSDKVRRIFGRRGAYAAFKTVLRERRMVDRWHEFENKAEEEALREWCADHSVDLVD